MLALFGITLLFGFIATVVSAIFWIVQKIRHRDTKALAVCITAALITVVSFFAIGIIYEPTEKTVEEPPMAESEEPAQSGTQAATETPPTVTTLGPEDAPQATTEPPAETQPTVTTPEPESTPEATTEPPEESDTPEEPEPADTPEQNPLLQFSIQTRPVMNGFKTERIGTWAYIETTKAAMKEVTDQQLKDYLAGLDTENYNWFNIFFEDGTGLYCMTGMGGIYVEYGPIDKNEGGSVPYENSSIYTFEDGTYHQTGGLVDVEAINKALIDSIPKEYQDERWFFAYCSESGSNGNTVSVSVQINLGKDDMPAAKDLAVKCYATTKQAVEDFYCNMESFNIMVVNKGAPVGMISTQDGTNYTIIASGKRSEFTVP